VIKRFLFLHPASLILPLFILWSAAHLDGFSWDYDEGTHTYESWLVQQGHPLYSETFSAYTPGYLMTLVAAYNVLGASMFTARLVTVLYAALGMLGVMLAAENLAQRLAPADMRARIGGQVAAAALLAATPFFFQWSRAAMSDLPSAAVTALAVALSLIYLRDRQVRWLFASEVVIALALWIKATALGGAAAIGLAMLLVLSEQRRDIRRALVGSLAIICLSAAPLLLFDIRGMYEQAIYFHVQKRVAYPLSLADNAGVLFDFLGQNLTLITLAAYAALTALLMPGLRRAAWVVVVWFVATWVSLVIQTPIFANHHPVILVFALAAAAGVGMTWAVADLGSALRAIRAQRRWAPHHFLTLAALALAVVGLAQLPGQLQAALAPPQQPPAEEAVALLRALTPPTDLLVSDAQVIAFRAQRQSPPALADTATARLASGNLTAEQLISITQQSDANAVLFWSGRLETATPFVDWVGQNYRLVRSSFEKPISSYRFYLRAPHPQYSLNSQFGDGITFLGYDLNRRSEVPIVAGQALSVTLYFRRSGVVDHSYTVFVHLLGANGHIAAQEDRPPLAGRYPTDQWKSNEWIVDEFALSLDPGAAAGNYQIEVGMYSPDNLQRLPVRSAGVRQPDDRLALEPIHVYVAQ
jgi:Dolichyl-phosphate-mannose-protein mannosyltransferase